MAARWWAGIAPRQADILVLPYIFRPDPRADAAVVRSTESGQLHCGGTDTVLGTRVGGLTEQ
jgi:hypothetical protein